MTVQAKLPQALPFGICSRSLARSAGGHHLPAKLEACAKAGLWAVEVAYECLEAYAKTLQAGSKLDLPDAIREAARQTNKLARSLGVVLVVLDAFEGYEGLVDRGRHEEKVAEWRFWVELAGIMGIEQIQIPATFDPPSECTGDLEVIVADLRELADIGLAVSPPVKIAYEPLSWSTHVDTWQKALEVCQRVGRPNIGLCLDTFHILSLLWGDPTAKDGLRANADATLRADLDALRKIPAENIILFQLSDGELLSPPMPESPYTEPGIDNLFAWSMHGRPFPGEGYYPVDAVCEAVFATGFRGITVMETFVDDAFDSRATILVEYASRALRSWAGITAALGLAPHRAPAAKGQNKLGTCTVNVGHYEYHDLEDKLYAIASTGHQAIDLYEDDFLYHISQQPDSNKKNLWEASPAHLRVAKRIGDLCASLGMEIICFQPLIDVEGLVDPTEREAAVERVKAYFPYMRALRTEVTYITTNRRYDFANITDDMSVIAGDLASFADLAANYAKADGGPMIKIGYEHLSWGSHINTFDKTWEAIKLADRPNLGFVFDTFNFLAVEYGDPVNPRGTGLIGSWTVEEARRTVRERLAKLVALIPGDKIYVCQVADAALVDPKSIPEPTPASEPWTPDHEPPYRAWSSGYRLFPNEPQLGGYMPVADCLAAILATGYQGAFTNEIFNNSIFDKGPGTVPSHAKRSYAGVASCVEEARAIPKFW